MSEPAGFWLRVEASVKISTVHGERCPSAQGAEAEYKGVERSLTEGGWFWFGTVDEIDAFHRSELAPHGFAEPENCTRCFGVL